MASTAIFIVTSFIVTIYSFKNKNIGWIIFFSFFARILFNIVHNHIFTLPAGCCDAVAFERTAWLWSTYNWQLFVELFNPRESYVISWFGGLVYKVLGREAFLLELINIIIGTITIIYVYKTSRLLMNNKLAKTATLLFAFHPTVMEHSVVYLREVQIILLITISIYNIILWYKTKNFKYFMYSLLYIIVSNIFHGGMISGVAGLLLVTGFIILNQYLSAFKSNVLKRSSFAISIVLLIGISYTIYNGLPTLSTVGNLSDFTETEVATEIVSEKSSNRARGGAAYLTGLRPSSFFDLLWQTPIRVIYFLLTPFPWQMSAITHLKGIIDSLFILYIMSIIIKNRKVFKRVKIYKYILIILIVYITAFSLGTSNFGSAIRHKSKFVPIMVLFVGLKQYNQKVYFENSNNRELRPHFT